MKGKKSVLIVTPFFRPNIGGVETVLNNLIKANKDFGYHSIVVTYQPLTVKVKGLKYEKGDGFEIYRVNWFGTGWFNVLEKYFPLVFLYLFPGLFIKTLSVYLKRYKEIVCVNPHGFIAGCITKMITSIKKKRVVANTHAIYNLKNRKLLALNIKEIYRNFDYIIPVSEVALEEFVYIGIPKRKLESFRNWIDTDVFIPREREDIARKLDITGDKNVLFVGRFIEKKGILLFLETAKKNPSINFHIVGSGDLEKEVKSSSDSFKNIFYYGKLRQDNEKDLDQLVNLYSLCDFFVSPFLYEEGFSTTLLESLACGTPVVITNRGSPPTFLDKKVAFYLSKSPTSEELSDTLKELFSRNLGLTDVCRQFAVENFSSKNASIIINKYGQN